MGLRISLRAVLLLACVGAATPVWAQPADCSKANTSGGTMSEGTYRQVERAIEDLAKDQYADAEKRLKDLSDRVRGYERAVVYQTLGFVYAQQDKYGPALKAFEEALAQNALPQQPQEQLLFNIGQIYMANNQYDKAIERLEKYLETACTPPPPEAHIQLASAYAERKRFRDALTQVDLALSKSKDVKEPWLQLKLALHYELKEFSKCAEVLVRLIALSPIKEEYWNQLSGVLFEIKRDEESLAVLALAERQGFFKKDSEYKNLANVYMLLDIPYKAGSLYAEAMNRGIIDKTSKNYEYLANSWIAAREWDRAIDALREAAKRGDDGSIWQRLGQVFMEKEDWKQATDAFERALKSGGVKEGETNYLLGVSAYNAGQTAKAERALLAASRESSTRSKAQEWLNHIRLEAAPAAPEAPEAPEAPANG